MTSMAEASHAPPRGLLLGSPPQQFCDACSRPLGPKRTVVEHYYGDLSTQHSYHHDCVHSSTREPDQLPQPRKGPDQT